MSLRVGDTTAWTICNRINLAYIDADTLSIFVHDAVGTITEYAMPCAEISRTSTGVYKFQFTISPTATPGTWAIRAHSVTGGVVNSAPPTRFTVQDVWS